jgi:hypothetical protein
MTLAWREQDELLQSAPGVGPVLSRTVLADLPELDGSQPGIANGSPRGWATTITSSCVESNRAKIRA